MKKLLCLLVLLVATNYNLAIANPMGGMDPGLINTQYMKELRFHEMKTRAKQKNAIMNTSERPQKEIVETQEVGEIQTINFVGNNAFTSEQLQEIVKDKIGTPLSTENVSTIRRNLMKFYQSQGYYSAIPVVVSQNNKTGEIVFEVQEGTKNSIVIE